LRRAPPHAERAAERRPAPAGAAPTLADVDPHLRLTGIDARLGYTAHTARVWTWGWGIGGGVATVANLVPLAFVAPVLTQPTGSIEDLRRYRSGALDEGTTIKVGLAFEGRF
jgi:hypothetical protein